MFALKRIRLTYANRTLNTIASVNKATMILNWLTIFLVMSPLNSAQENYKGESFPIKYLMADDVVPESSDVEYYLHGLNRMLDRFEMNANNTDINRAVGLFYMTTILKRTIKENKNKMQEKQLKLINEILLKADNVTSHYMYKLRDDSWDMEKRTWLFEDQDLQIEAIGEFNRNRLQKWIVKNTQISDLAKDMDELKLQRMDYLKLNDISVMNASYSIALPVSDYCLSNIIYNPKPHDTSQKFTPCLANKFCSLIVYENSISMSYTLSHRMLNVMFPRHVRRCYMRSIEEDDLLLDVLCSFMYRETVYIARLGFFFRDMWMEHIALCGLLGYKEFFRRDWFRKVMSWVDQEGCIAEHINTSIRRSMIVMARKNPKDHEKERKKLQEKLTAPCHWHQMAVGLIVLAHAVRHSVHFSEADRGILKDEL